MLVKIESLEMSLENILSTRSSIWIEPLTTDQEVSGSNPDGCAILTDR